MLPFPLLSLWEQRQRKLRFKKMQAAGAFLKRLPFSLRVAPRETVATIGELVKGNLS